jgi:hypothetical protein
MQATQDERFIPTRLSVRDSVLWLIGSFFAPFFLVAVASIAIAYWLMGANLPQFATLLPMAAYYGFLAGVLGFTAIAISFLAGKYWFLLASFTGPALLIGGTWGTWSWFKHCDDLARSYPEQQAHSLFSAQEIGEWLTYVAGGCAEIGLSIVVFFNYQNARKKIRHQ